MWYMILGRDAAGTLDARLSARPAHLARLKVLLDEGRVLLAGPLPAADTTDPGMAGYLGSLIVAEFPSQAEARAWADADPYVTAGVYRDVQVMPFKKVLP